MPAVGSLSSRHLWFPKGVHLPDVSSVSRNWQLTINILCWRQVPRRLFDRLQYIVMEQDWEKIAHTFWLKHALVRAATPPPPPPPFASCSYFSCMASLWVSDRMWTLDIRSSGGQLSVAQPCMAASCGQLPVALPMAGFAAWP